MSAAVGAARRAGPVTTVVLDRPEARNAVDRDTAAALRREFELGKGTIDHGRF